MRITDISFKKVNDKFGKVKAIASIVLDDEIVIHDIKIVEGVKGIFVAMPSREKYNVFNGENRFMDIVHPINNSTRKYLTENILSSYEIFLEEEEVNQDE